MQNYTGKFLTDSLTYRIMKSSFYSYHYKNSRLMAVPAVHHRTAFARKVHASFREQKQTTDAVAVELGHGLVIELVSFLKKLGQGTGEKVMLPCMLGIMKRNRYLDPAHSERAILLQEFYRSPLYNLPENLLAERLNFSKWSTIFISPADSIVEAVRCAIELDIPVYGVDLSDFAITKTDHFRIEDPHNSGITLNGYSDRVLQYCDAGRDPRIDLNRETMMAAGLKYCLEKHSNVLFTCGMAHWKSLVSLLDDDRIRPVPVTEIPGESEFRRVIVHPSLAAPVMEIIPQLTFNYEKERQPINLPLKKNRPVKPEDMIRGCLDKIYNDYSSSAETGKSGRSGSAKWSNISIYEQYLFQLSAVRQRVIPDLAAMLDSAKVTMSDDFCRLITQRLMEVSPEWASHDDFPDLPVMIPTATDTKAGKGNIIAKKVRVQSGSRRGYLKNMEDGLEVYTNLPVNQGIGSVDINMYWEWIQTKKDNPKQLRFGNPWIWPPCESLLYGIAFKAAEMSNINNKKIHDSLAFSGSLEGGIDIKATMRSSISGEKNIYVSKLATAPDQAIFDGINPDPFVLIFPETSDLQAAEWAFFTAGSDLGQSVKDTELFNRIKREKGSVFVSSILLEEKVSPPAHLKALIYDMTKTIGTVMFGNPCINARQSAIWLETAEYKCCPILTDHGMASLINYYSDHFDLEFNIDDWRESLIRMAIPFAKKIITILAPDSYIIPERVKSEASSKRIILNSVSISNFSESQLEEAQIRFSICTLDRLGLEFPPEAEILLGQTKETYFEMLPYAIRKQVGYAEKINC